MIFYAKKKDNTFPRSCGVVPVTVHARDCAGVMEYLILHRIPQRLRSVMAENEDLLCKIALFLGYIHDIGKISFAFQKKIRGEHTLPFSHAYAGEAILLAAGAPSDLASIVGGHHGMPRPAAPARRWAKRFIRENGREMYGDDRQYYEDAQHQFIADAFKLSGISSFSDLPKFSKKQLILWVGILIYADWLSSCTDFFPLLEVGENARYPERINAGIAAMKFPEIWHPTIQNVNHSYFKDRFGFSPNIIQETFLKAISEATDPGLFILEAPMGGGKTEAALAGAEILASKFGASGMLFALPTQATANSIFPRISEWAANQAKTEGTTLGIRLAHSAAELNDCFGKLEHSSNTDLTVHPWFGRKKIMLLEDFVVSTIDQVLMVGLKTRHQFLRMLGLASKILVIDECHAYDSYMMIYLERVLNWCGEYGVPVIVLSATLPDETRARLCCAYRNINPDVYLEQHPETLNSKLQTVTYVSQTTKKSYICELPSRGNVSVRYLSNSNIVSDLREHLSCGGCAGVIVNTIQKAQRLYDKITSSFPDYDVILSHSGYTQHDRACIEKRILKRVGKYSVDRDRLIVIGTQVLEQSMDIDFDYMITDLCPIDLLLQRVGRLHRHNRIRPFKLKNPIVSVITTKGIDSASQAIYGTYLLKRTQEVLPETIRLPEDISMLVEKVYSAQYVSGEDSDYDAYQATIADKRVRAQSFTIPAPGALPNDLSGFLATSSGSGLVRDSIMPITAIVLSDDDIKKKITLENMARREKLDRTIRLPKTFADMLGEKRYCRVYTQW